MNEAINSLEEDQKEEKQEPQKTDVKKIRDNRCAQGKNDEDIYTHFSREWKTMRLYTHTGYIYIQLQMLKIQNIKSNFLLRDQKTIHDFYLFSLYFSPNQNFKRMIMQIKNNPEKNQIIH